MQIVHFVTYTLNRFGFVFDNVLKHIQNVAYSTVSAGGCYGIQSTNICGGVEHIGVKKARLNVFTIDKKKNTIFLERYCQCTRTEVYLLEGTSIIFTIFLIYDIFNSINRRLAHIALLLKYSQGCILYTNTYRSAEIC